MSCVTAKGFNVCPNTPKSTLGKKRVLRKKYSITVKNQIKARPT